MGFLRRLFSGVGKSSKAKRQRADVERQRPARVTLDEEEAEATITRMLRSSSVRFEALAQTDYLAPPPHIPHSLDSLSPYTTPAGSITSRNSRSPSPTLSFVSAAPSRSYSVTIHERTVHTPATLGTAASSLSSKRTLAHDDREENGRPHKRDKRSHERDGSPDCDDSLAPSDQSCLVKLRRDPSVTTLLNMYDEHGCVNAGSFESPEKVGRAQVQRSGSTLRNLLGGPDTRDGPSPSQEGDISWAERILGEGALDPSSRLSKTSLEFPPPVPSESCVNTSADTNKDNSINFPPWSDSTCSTALSTQDRARHVAIPDPPAEESPIKPAAEVFAFLLAPRKSKASTATLDPAMLNSRPSQVAPPMPPAPSSRISRELPLLPIRTGSSGIPRHQFLVADPVPVTASHGRSRSHSTSATEMFEQHERGHGRSATVATPSRIPRGPQSTSRAPSRGQSRPGTSLGLASEVNANVGAELEADEAPLPTRTPVASTSRIPVLWAAAESKSRPASGMLRASSVGPSTVLGSTPAKSSVRPMSGVFRASSVGPSMGLSSTPAKSSARPMSGVVRASSVGPSSALEYTVTKPSGRPTSGVVRASSLGPSSALGYGDTSARDSKRASHRRASSLVSSSANTTLLLDEPELAEVQQAVKVNVGHRGFALHPEARRLPAPPPAPAAGRRVDKENSTGIPVAVMRAIGAGANEKALPALPMTPVRTRPAMQRAAANGAPPSPASSTELSPLGKELMANIREQRLRAREREKEIKRQRGTGSRARSKTPVLA